MIVMKFGGTSVGSIDAFTQVAQIVGQRVAAQAGQAQPGVVVVTSAMSSVTNTLIDAARKAATGDEAAHRETANALLVKHQTVAGHFIDDGNERAALGHLLSERLHEFDRLCSSIAVLGELTSRGLDVVSGLGEQLSAPLLAAVLRAQGIAAEYVDAREIVITDDIHDGAEPLMDETAAQTRSRLLPLLKQGIVPVVTGFIGSSKAGVPTTLGRGGSDYSAAILGSVLQATEIEIWTDVNGVMTADPRVVTNAQPQAT
ncbi:MAG: aspartate kinase [Caldilineaceae bacterium]